MLNNGAMRVSVQPTSKGIFNKIILHVPGGIKVSSDDAEQVELGKNGYKRTPEPAT